MLQYYINAEAATEVGSLSPPRALEVSGVDRAPSHVDVRARRQFPAVLGLSLAAHTIVLAGLLLGIAAPNAGGGATELEVVSVSIVSATELQTAANTSAPTEAPQALQSPDQPGSDSASEARASAQPPTEVVPPTPALPPPPLNAALLEAPPVAEIKPPDAKPPSEPDPTPSQAAAADARQRGGAAPAPASLGGVAEGDASASRGAIDRYARDVALLVGRNRPKGVGLKGQVTVEFTLSPASGALQSVAVVRSSRQPKLDALAVAAIEQARYPAPPAGMTDSQLTYRVPFTFQ